MRLTRFVLGNFSGDACDGERSVSSQNWGMKLLRWKFFTLRESSSVRSLFLQIVRGKTKSSHESQVIP